MPQGEPNGTKAAPRASRTQQITVFLDGCFLSSSSSPRRAIRFASCLLDEKRVVACAITRLLSVLDNVFCYPLITDLSRQWIGPPAVCTDDTGDTGDKPLQQLASKRLRLGPPGKAPRSAVLHCDAVGCASAP